MKSEVAKPKKICAIHFPPKMCRYLALSRESDRVWKWIQCGKYGTYMKCLYHLGSQDDHTSVLEYSVISVDHKSAHSGRDIVNS